MEEYNRDTIYNLFCSIVGDESLRNAFSYVLDYVEENDYRREFMLKKDRFFNDIRSKVKALSSYDMIPSYLEGLKKQVETDFRNVTTIKAECLKRLKEQVKVASSDFKGEGESREDIQSLANRRALAIEKLLKVLYSTVNLDEWIYEELVKNNSVKIDDIDAFFDKRWKGIVNTFWNGSSRDDVALSYNEDLQTYIKSLNAHSHYPILEQLPLNIQNLIKYELATGKVRDSFHDKALLSVEDFFLAPDYFLLSRDFKISDDIRNSLRDVIAHSNVYDKDRYNPGSLNKEDNDFLAEFACSVYVALSYEMNRYEEKLGKSKNDMFKDIIERDPSKSASLKYISELPSEFLKDLNYDFIVDIIENFSLKEIQWLFDTVSKDESIKLNDMAYYCMFFKKYVKNKCEEFSLNPEKYARINNLFTMISNANDLSKTSSLISLWFSSIRLQDLSSEEIQEIEKIDNKYFMKSLTVQDKILYEKCKKLGINFEFYYKRFTFELIEYLNTLFKGMSIPLEALNYCFTTLGSRIEWSFKVSDLNLALLKANGPYEDIQNIIDLYNMFNIEIKNIPGAAFKLSFKENYDLLKDTNGRIDLNFLNELADSKDNYDDEFSNAIIEVLKKSNVLPMYYHLIINYFKTFSNCDVSLLSSELTYNIEYLRNRYGLDPSQPNYPYYYLFNLSSELTKKLDYIESFHIYDMKNIPSYVILQNMDFLENLYNGMNKGVFCNASDWTYECFSDDTKALELIQVFLTTLKPSADMLPLGINEVVRNYLLCKEYTHDDKLQPGDWLFYKDPGETKIINNLAVVRGIPFRVEFMYFDLSILKLHFKEINSKLSFLDDLGVPVMYELCEKITNELGNSMSSVNIQPLFLDNDDSVKWHSRAS